MTVVQFDPPIDEATRVMYEAVAAGLTTVGAARGLPPMRWAPHHDWAPVDRRSRVYGYPLTSAGDWDGVDVAQQWAQILDLVELDRDQAFDQLQENVDEGVRLWHGIVNGIRVIILVQTIRDTRPVQTAVHRPTPPRRPQRERPDMREPTLLRSVLWSWTILPGVAIAAALGISFPVTAAVTAAVTVAAVAGTELRQARRSRDRSVGAVNERNLT